MLSNNLKNFAAALIAALALSACVSFPDAPQARFAPTIEADGLHSIDGAVLAIQRWEAEAPRAVIIALHGMNDYSHMFSGPAEYWAEQGVTTYAIDQRGFGRSPEFGHWVGEESMIADLRAAIAAARVKHPGLPVFVAGHSMGAGVILAGEAEAPLGADGLILAAPGVWGGRALPIPYRVTANIAATFAPGKTLSGERVQRRATDNIEILREMYADPLVIKETRLDAILGVTRVMGSAYNKAQEVRGDILFLMGEKDEIIPLKAMEKTAMRLSGDITFRRYSEGWHMLFRDLQAPAVWRDVADWVLQRSGDPAPEGDQRPGT
ncbi:alpha/beta fold hydrolase [Hyphococcus sp.]|uniref:alpha/beta fold hydrolase n=1 Tax=Hyphococcus sp. TaxID=2038636 RepID=UPI0020862089|nr:MAG: alpha/beta hydrolase [Marinicaulis sp.]